MISFEQSNLQRLSGVQRHICSANPHVPTPYNKPTINISKGQKVSFFSLTFVVSFLCIPIFFVTHFLTLLPSIPSFPPLLSLIYPSISTSFFTFLRLFTLYLIWFFSHKFSSLEFYPRFSAKILFAILAADPKGDDVL